MLPLLGMEQNRPRGYEDESKNIPVESGHCRSYQKRWTTNAIHCRINDGFLASYVRRCKRRPEQP